MTNSEPVSLPDLHQQIRQNFEASMKKSVDSGEVDYIDALGETERQFKYAETQYHDEYDRDYYRTMQTWTARNQIIESGGFMNLAPELREKLVTSARTREFKELAIEHPAITPEQRSTFEDAANYLKFMLSPRGMGLMSEELDKKDKLTPKQRQKSFEDRRKYWNACDNLVVYSGLYGLYDFEPALVAEWAAKFKEIIPMKSDPKAVSGDTEEVIENIVFTPYEVAQAKTGLNQIITLMSESTSADDPGLNQLKDSLEMMNGGKWDNVSPIQIESWISHAKELETRLQ
jgi:hypothetical protein